ncbi:hypothetical protein L1049_022444 [Liquidambar formosana]|uniref:Uncharacterized protein n=1 Tax=Liquidambar formosana TaxID=63359 RepID=A0AAP0WR44_LIQFO
MVHTIAAFGVRLLGLTVTAASFVLSSSPICLPNPWELGLGFSCTRAIYEFQRSCRCNTEFFDDLKGAAFYLVYLIFVSQVQCMCSGDKLAFNIGIIFVYLGWWIEICSDYLLIS